MQLEKFQLHASRYRTPALLVLATVLAATASGAETGSAPVAHEKIGCGECHGANSVVASSSSSQASAGSESRSSRCVACHGRPQAASDADHQFHQKTSRSCLTCHSFHHPSVLRAGDREFSVTFGDANTQSHCRSCHAPKAGLERLDDGHRFAAETVYHDDKFDLTTLSPSDGCLLCHDLEAEAVQLPAHVAPTPRFHTEASHPYGVRVSPGQGPGSARIRPDIDPRIPLPGGMIECQTCHLITGATKKLLLPFDDPYALCLGCHQVRQRQFDGPGPLALSGSDDPLHTTQFMR